MTYSDASWYLWDELKLQTPGPVDEREAKAQQTLLAIEEFKPYLEDMEKDLSRMSKKLHNKEIAQSVGFVATGIHEALQYLTIIRKVVKATSPKPKRET